MKDDGYKKPGDAATPPSPNDNSNTDINIITQLLLESENKKVFLQRLPRESEIAIFSGTCHRIARKDKNLKPDPLLNLATSQLTDKHPVIIHCIESYRREALDFASYVLDKVNLPLEVQQRIKKLQGEKHRREYMEKDPPTEKQIKFLRELGYEGTVQNKLEASEMISKVKGNINE